MFSRRLILLDFDGTLTTKDTLFEFIKYYHGTSKYILGMIILFPIFILFKIKLLSSQTTKEATLTWFFKYEPIDKFNTKCNSFSNEIIPSLIRDGVNIFLEENRAKSTISIVSASLENWVCPWAKSMGINCIGTKLQVVNARVTGKILGGNCNGTEKVSRIKQEYDLSTYNEIIVFGDSVGDYPMLNIATTPHFNYFHTLTNKN